MSNREILVSAENVQKKFCRSLQRSLRYGMYDMITEVLGGSLSHDRLRKDEFWAVNGVSFELRRGESLGLIGHNGAGKTTLLRMLNGLIKPDHGSITMRGRVAALIALGAGFNPILSGRENVYVNGSVLGLTKKEIDAKFDEIVDFSGVRDFIEAPLQTYSSGMQVRLGFSIAAQLNPDLLIVDEVLAVGDIEFRNKGIKKMQSLLSQGTSVIFISHNMQQVTSICTKGILLERGRMLFSGPINEAIEKFYQTSSSSQGGRAEDPNESDRETGVSVSKMDLSTSRHETRPDSLEITVDITVKSASEVTCIPLLSFTENQSLAPLGIFMGSLEHEHIRLVPGENRITLRLGNCPFGAGTYVARLSLLDTKHLHAIAKFGFQNNQKITIDQDRNRPIDSRSAFGCPIVLRGTVGRQ